jgi:hypothetical protein
MFAYLPDWATATSYQADQIVYVPNEGPPYIDRVYRCVTNHVSNSFPTDFGNGLWTQIIIRGAKGDQGVTGATGAAGATGATGAQGSAGAAGANGIFSEIASQAEAEAGAENTKGMTSLRVKNAIDAQVGALRDTNFPALASRVTTAEGLIASISNRLTQVEGTSQVSRATGSQRLLNNQTSPVALLGKDAPGNSGAGNKLQLNPAGATSAQVVVELFRKDDLEVRATRMYLELHYIEGTWYLGIKNIVTLIGEDTGVVFSVTQDGDDVAQISYESDDMAGGNYSSSSYIRYMIEEIPATLGF